MKQTIILNILFTLFILLGIVSAWLEKDVKWLRINLTALYIGVFTLHHVYSYVVEKGVKK